MRGTGVGIGLSRKAQHGAAPEGHAPNRVDAVGVEARVVFLGVALGLVGIGLVQRQNFSLSGAIAVAVAGIRRRNSYSGDFSVAS
jgi:hypothetical protein